MKAFRALFISVVIMLLSSAAYCGDNDWHWAFGVSSSFGSCAGGFGVTPLASDNYDSNDTLLTGNYATRFGTYHQQEQNEWNGPTGFYQEDMRAPMSLQYGNCMSWLIYVWGAADLPDTATWLSIYVPNLGSTPTGLDTWLTLKAKPESITDGPAAGTSWHLSDVLSMYTRLPMYRTDNGLTGYQFELTATVIPEPASVFTLMSGIMGLGWFGRKKV